MRNIMMEYQAITECRSIEHETTRKNKHKNCRGNLCENTGIFEYDGVLPFYIDNNGSYDLYKY